MAIHIISKNTLVELKATEGSVENIIITLGQSTKGDGRGALYYWDASSTEAEDSAYYNTVIADNITTGRWKKVFTRMIQLPHGTLVMNAGKKEFFCNTTINSNSEAIVNLTYDNTTNGTAIFSEVWFDDSKAIVNTNTVNDAVAGWRKSLTNSNRQLTHGFYRGNNSIISVIGLNILGFRNAVTGTNVNFKVEGI